jgi:hypothetical protein
MDAVLGKTPGILWPLVGAIPMVLLVLPAWPLCLISVLLSAARRRHIIELLKLLLLWASVITGRPLSPMGWDRVS